MKVIAVLPPGLEDEGARELKELGACLIKTRRRSVLFEADMRCLYRVNLLARLPFRFLREIARFPCHSRESLYWSTQQSFNWNLWLKPNQTFRVDSSGNSFALPHSHFTALTVKNALVDLQRQVWGERSNIDIDSPDICIHVHLNNDEAVLSLDTSSQSLHKRGYRMALGIAPLKENLAAGLIRLSNWNPTIPLVDPLCGSGTLLIEAANIALARPAGLNRSYLLQGWYDFDHDLWTEEYQSARQSTQSQKCLPIMLGCDKNTEIVKQAKNNIEQSGLEGSIEIKNHSFQDLSLPSQKGFLVCNPPYGKRSGYDENLKNLYQELGLFCKNQASGWELWLLNGNPELSKFLKLKSRRRIPISNGGIDCRWLNYLIN